LEQTKKLIAEQFPQWANLRASELPEGGWDNRSVRLGEKLIIRMPSAECYASQVDVEQKWLPKLAPLLPVAIPTPVARGNPSESFPWPWSIYRWLPGETVTAEKIPDMRELAIDLANFLLAFHRIPPDDGPASGARNFHRGGLLAEYNRQARTAIKALASIHDRDAIARIWAAAVKTRWQQNPVWVHGDFAPRNLLLTNGRLSGVIDFGQLGVGDPACDLAVAWTILKGESRQLFRNAMKMDAATWLRAKAWVVWKSAILITGHSSGPQAEITIANANLAEVMGDC
jgi:aminoglycoside phosphotransferase (APT) family kinase protein